jgi:hypothetical protein
LPCKAELRFSLGHAMSRSYSPLGSTAGCQHRWSVCNSDCVERLSPTDDTEGLALFRCQEQCFQLHSRCNGAGIQ